MVKRQFLLFLILALLPGWLREAVAQQDPRSQMLSAINSARATNGVPPLALNQVLSAAAQGHSEDMAANDFVDHTGSGGSSLADRLTAEGFPRYSSGLVATEAVYRSSEGMQEAFDWWMSSPSHEDILLSTFYREIGLGVATGANGREYWAVTLGARPNVLPVFINQGAVQTESQEVLLTLSNEGGMVNGDGPEVIGLATEIRLANQPDLEASEWQAWVGEMSWTLAPGDGEKTVYVEFRDGEGRSATSQASIILGEMPAEEPTVAAGDVTSAAVTPAATSPVATRPPVTLEPVTIAPTATPVPTPTPFSRPVPIGRWLDLRPERIWPAVCGLQIIGVLLGILVIVRRQRSNEK